ncbi:hypothetical protein [Anaerostipes sp.]|uniref:hypothetical protein n=1 Tax=Anaerostipes sp. TaxID=1872530 RepID=UPI0025C5BB5E|nr:hypothetical protein [Anaerostipes sp.]MBS7009718.1 hypothetical protein [Anaerostipes sp.]
MTNAKAAQVNTKKLSLKEKIKKYFLDNCDVISAGITAMNGGHYYIPPKKRL